MDGFERPLTCKGISELTGGAISEESVRSFCHRGPKNHPLPHVRTGRSGKLTLSVELAEGAQAAVEVRTR